MDADVISQVLRARAQVITVQELLSDGNDQPAPSDYYDVPHRDAVSTALKEEQRCEDLLAEREEQSSKIKTLSAVVDPEKLKRAKELLRKKEELIQKRDELNSLLKAKKVTLSDVFERRDHMIDHDSKISLLACLSDDCEQFSNEIEQYGNGKTSISFDEG